MKSKISVIFLLLFIPLFSQDIRVISSDNRSLLVEYTPTYSDTSIQLINNDSFFSIKIDDGYFPEPEQWGMPAVPEKLLSIGVPTEFGNTIQILSSEYKEFFGKIIPKPKMYDDSGLVSFKYQLTNEYYEYKPAEETVAFGDFAILRGMPVQYLKLMPVKFEPSQNKITLFTRIIFRINYSSTQISQKIIKTPADDFLYGVVLNYDAAQNWIKESDNKKLRKVAANSVLSEGKWFRFEASEEGIYKISRADLSKYGIDAAAVDPRTIKIYNNSGKILPEAVTVAAPSDLVENAITVVGEEDGKFDEGDYILFYGRGIGFWEYDTATVRIKRYFSTYSKQNYYWITSGGSLGKRIQNKASLNEAIKIDQPSTQAFVFLEEDKFKISQTGRYYLGDDFSNTALTRTYTNKLDGRLDQFPVKYKFRFINGSEGSIGLKVEENGTNIFSENLQGFGGQDHKAGYQFVRNLTYIPSLPENRSVLKFNLSPTSASSVGYLDYFEINYERTLTAVNDYLLFFSKDTTSIIEYNLNGFSSSNIKIFNVTDYANVKIISNPISDLPSAYRFQVNETAGRVSKYIAMGNDNFRVPSNPVEILNQDLHGISEGAKFIIITHENFRVAAERLKSYRESGSKIPVSTIVINVEKIFNEFSGGISDPTAIRNFIKYAYDNWSVKPEYVLLFGDGSYDYKSVEGGNNNFIPAYEIPLIKDNAVTDILDLINSYPKDDYYVCVDGNDLVVDLAIGRLNIQTSSDAEIIVDKIMEYESNSEIGTWRNLITLVADDNLTTEGIESNVHVPQSETLGNIKIPQSFDLKKIYLESYPTILTGFGRTKPGVNKEIINAVNQGTLILNYIGHGRYDLWAHENVFIQSSTIPQMKNDKYFFLTAATCDFGYYDFTSYQSATEELILKEKSGAIAAFTSARPVYSFENAQLNEFFFDALLKSPRDINNLSIPIGKAYFKTKTSKFSQNDQKFHLYGDPTLRLSIPQYSATIDSINGIPLDSAIQLKALSNVKIDGVIKKADNSIWDDFNGEGILTVFDSQRAAILSSTNLTISIQGGIIFRGRMSIMNGRYSANFVVPKDISYENKNGKVLLYFFNNEVDGVGYTNKLLVGGTDLSTTNDGKGPDIEIYFDDINYKSTFLVNPNSKLIVKLNDETGINTTGTGVGHKLEGILNDKENDPIDFSNYFTGDLDAGGKSGSINYQLNGLETGDYKLRVKAWDVFNNFSSSESFFKVINGDELVIDNVYNYPNPFHSNTTFTFQKNNVNSPVDVKIKVYTVAGRLIWEIERNNLVENFVKIDWDGRDQDGNPLANGTYLYKLIVKSIGGEFNKSVLGKLAVIR